MFLTHSLVLQPFLDSALITMKKKKQQNFVRTFSSMCTQPAELLSAWDLVHLVNS